MSSVPAFRISKRVSQAAEEGRRPSPPPYQHAPRPDRSDDRISGSLAHRLGSLIPYQPNADPDAVNGVPEAGARLTKTRAGQLQASMGSLQAFEGLVAAPGFSAISVFTTPNQRWVPEFAIAHGEITTYSDGRWGRHEYSCWPQAYAPECLHMACIPRRSSPPKGSSTALWDTVSPSDWEWENCGMVGAGFIRRERLARIEENAAGVIERLALCRQDRKEWNKIAQDVIVCLRHSLDRLRMFPAPRDAAISLAAHVQRLILELCGIEVLLTTVLDRIESHRDCTADVLDVVGAHTPNPEVAQAFYRAGVPVWFQQPLTRRLSVYEIVAKTDIPAEFSRTPAYPRLVLAKRDTSGLLNAPGLWLSMMSATVRRQLCASSLPELSRPETQPGERPSKRFHGGQEECSYGSSLYPDPSTYAGVARNPDDAKALGHDLHSTATSVPSVPPQSKKKQPSRRSRRRPGNDAKQPGEGSTGMNQRPSQPFVMHPSRQFYPSNSVSIAVAWSKALRSASPLSQPPSSATFYYPPPWLLDSLIGYNGSPNKHARHLHHFLSIRAFCRLRLFDPTIAGRPLTGAEWRDALFGDYDCDRLSAGEDGVLDGRAAVRLHLKKSVRQLFGNFAALRSYDITSAPELEGRVVTYQTALTDREIQRRLVWEAHEVNWRCELLSLDALIVGSKGWPEMERWIREADVSRVWGLSSSGMDIAPRDGVDMTKYCWSSTKENEWEMGREHLQAFLNILNYWPNCPAQLRGRPSAALLCTRAEYDPLMECAVTFYVSTFVAMYHRLPIPPVRGVAPSSL